MTDLAALKAANVARWSKAKLTRNFSAIAKALVAAKPRYQAVEAKTGVPWFAIAVIHQRESSQSWTRSLAQGDPINRVSVNVPAGRGPFKSWEDAAVDALVNCGPFLAKKKDWSLGAALVNLELYNGAGYANRGRPSPYLWAGTDQYSSGKYVRDGLYDAATIDSQPGCAGMLKAMMALDPSIKFKTSTSTTAKKSAGAVAAGGAAGAAAHQAGLGVGWIIAISVVGAAMAAFGIWEIKK